MGAAIRFVLANTDKIRYNQNRILRLPGAADLRGNPGRGKTHISIAIGLKACLQGYRVLFKNAGTLATELTEARDAYQLGKIERQMEKTDLLILDELSYMSFSSVRI